MDEKCLDRHQTSMSHVNKLSLQSNGSCVLMQDRVHFIAGN